jgi:ribonuclease VapC
VKTIALDTSALAAIALYESDAASYAEIIAGHRALIGWPTVFELHMVLCSRIGHAQARDFVAGILADSGTRAVSFDAVLFEAAREAFDTYGRRAGARRLNFGDCLAYAVAKANNIPLLFKGQDFLVTDIRPALS